MNYRVDIVTELDQWLDFESCSFFNSKYWASLLLEDRDALPLLVIGYGDNGAVVAVQNGLLMRQLHGLPFYFGTSCVLWGEPQSLTSELVPRVCYEQMLDALMHYCRHRAVMLEARHFTKDSLYESIFTSRGFKSLPWYNVINRLSTSEFLLKGMSKRRARQVRSALRQGAVIEYSPSLSQWASYYEILERNYRLIHRPLPKFEAFNYLLQHPEIGTCIVILSPQGEVIGGIACLHGSGTVCYAWYEAGLERLPAYAKYYPSILSNYAALLSAVNNKCCYFDFQGAGSQTKPYGVRDFKLRFGGDLIETMRYRRFLWL